MKRTFDRIAEALFFSVVTILNLTATCWAGPPSPPDLSSPIIPIPGIPSTPIGGTEITIATTIAMAGYGYWKSRK